jgi:hypothetical protein
MCILLFIVVYKQQTMKFEKQIVNLAPGRKSSIKD